MRKNKAKPNQILVLRSIHFASHDLNGVNEVRHLYGIYKMTKNQKMAMAEKHVQNIHDNLEKEFPNISMIGVTPEEKEIAKKVHAIMWLAALEQKPGKYKEADDFTRNIIICNAVMIDIGIIDEHAEVIR